LHSNPSTLEIMAFFFLFFCRFFFLFSFGFMGDARSAASIKINAHTMRTVQLKTFNKNFNYEGHYFFILNKGMNSGKPMKSSCPNCFVCIAGSEEEKEQLYWLCFALMVFKILSLLPERLCNSIITIDDTKECLSKSLLKSNQNKADFQAAIQQAKKFEELENLMKRICS
jgi:hypothetical protein